MKRALALAEAALADEGEKTVRILTLRERVQRLQSKLDRLVEAIASDVGPTLVEAVAGREAGAQRSSIRVEAAGGDPRSGTSCDQKRVMGMLATYRKVLRGNPAEARRLLRVLFMNR